MEELDYITSIIEEYNHYISLGFKNSIATERLVDSWIYPITRNQMYDIGYADGKSDREADYGLLLEYHDSVMDILIDENVPVSIRNKIERLKNEM